MVRSMTGFGRAKYSEGGLNITVEFKSVNHRYFEFTSRLPKGYMFLDEKLKSFCQQKISRGKLEAAVVIEDNTENAAIVEVNGAYADAYLTAIKKISKLYHIKNDVKMSSLVSNPEFFTVKKQALPEETVTAAVLKTAEEAMQSFISMRETEGERLKKDVKMRTDLILERVAFVEERSPETVKAYREKLEQKIKELIDDVQVDEQRLLTETAIFADKVAVAEETVRLKSHIKQFCSLLDSAEPIGRKLDFIVQEMNREANTIGSKAQDIEIAHTVVDIKSEIEKIREQIQNIE
ncbi:MAG: YicC/YloC family endoribonuclease [Acutalibacteraceae bacterium]|nr:YicC/YloC family endoribonuclease [Acutalibacteraceae bacterium]